MASATEIANALAGRTAQTRIGFRYELRDSVYALLSDITSAVLSGRITLENDRMAVRTIDLMIDGAEMPSSFNRDTEAIAPTMTLIVPLDAGGQETVNFALGLYYLIDIQRSHTEGAHETWRARGSDPGIRLAATLNTPFSIASGQNYISGTNGVEDLLDDAGVAHALPAVVDVTPSGFSWGPTDTHWSVARDLTETGINYYGPYADSTGRLISKQRIDPSTETPDVIYSTEQEPRMVVSPFGAGEAVRQDTNDAVVLVDDPNRAAFFERRQNSDPASPISTATLGRSILKEIVGDRVVSQTRAGDVADFLVREAAAEAERATLVTTIDPRRAPRETYRLTVDNVENQTLWRVLGWTMPLESGAMMRHTIARARSISVVEP